MSKSVFGVAIAMLLATTSAVLAGGFAVREQSVKGQGLSFAGVAAGGGGLSSIFWNPAVSSDYNEFGFISEGNYSLVVPHSESNLGSGNIGKLALVPASYASYAVTDQLTIAASMNAPLGLTTDARDGWVGNPAGDKSKVVTYNFNPSISYKLNDMLSIGIGAQVEYMSVGLTARSAGAGVQLYDMQGDDIGVGFTAGLLFEPTDTTDIGIGFRSSVSHNLKGDALIGLATTNISAKFDTPETVTLGIRQQVNDQLTLLGGVEWANWSRFKQLVAYDGTGAAIKTDNHFWKDSWFFSAGAEYAYNDALTLRAGAAFEKSPVPDAFRSVRVPDNDRYWLSLGASYRLTDSMTANIAYSHVFIKDGPVLAPVVTSFKQNLNIVSVGLTTDW